LFWCSLSFTKTTEVYIGVQNCFVFVFRFVFFGDQRSKTWRSREAKNYKSREAGKSRKTNIIEAEKQRSRETDIKKKQNGKT
jgi:hypothetical protein